MTLLTRSVSSRSLVFVLSLFLTFVVGAGFQPAQAQNRPDLDDIQKIIDEARSIVAKAKECVGIADDAQREADLAVKENKDAEANETKATNSRMTAEGKANLVATEKVKAETAATQAEQAAKDAADAAKKAKAEADDVADDVVIVRMIAVNAVCPIGHACIQSSVANMQNVTVPRQPTDDDIKAANKARADAAVAVMKANAAAVRQTMLRKRQEKRRKRREWLLTMQRKQERQQRGS